MQFRAIACPGTVTRMRLKGLYSRFQTPNFRTKHVARCGKANSCLPQAHSLFLCLLIRMEEFRMAMPDHGSEASCEAAQANGFSESIQGMDGTSIKDLVPIKAWSSFSNEDNG